MPRCNITRSPSTLRLAGALLLSTCFALPGLAEQAVPSPATTAAPDTKATPEAKMGGQANTDGQTQTSGQAQTSAAAGKNGTTASPQDQRSADARAFFDAGLAALHAGLTLDAVQEPLWAPVETAIRDLQKTRGRLRDREQVANLLQKTPSDLLRMRSEQLIQRGDAMRKLVDATGPLLDKIDDSQKRRLPMLLAGLRPGRILRAAFDIRNGRVDDPDDTPPKSSRRVDHDGSGDGGMGQRYGRMHGQDDDQGEGASYERRGDAQTMKGQGGEPADD